ncbi:MAG TPA: hypothetical protein VHM31_04510 [Polyangia bacterium]|nr:hypothetical protein [Polyangia bacterium]
MRGRLRAAAVLVVALLAPAGARAQLAPAPPGSPPAAEKGSEADALIEQAARAYDGNRLDEALDLLGRAYALSPRPSILYNQAQVWRAKDDCAAALDAYSRFIAATTPDDPNRARADRRRTEMQACVDRRKAEAASAPSPPAAEPSETAPVLPPPSPVTAPAAAPAVALASPPAPSGDESDSHRRRVMRIAGWTLVGAGVVAAGAAAAFAWEAHQHQNELNEKIDGHVPWTGGPQSLADAGERDASWARWLGAAAAVAGGGGVALLIVSRPPAAAGGVGGSPPPAATALLGWSGTF